MDIGAHPSSRATASDAVRLARELYGLEARLSPLPSEYDDNFLVETPDGVVRVLKVMHPMRDAGFVDLQCAALKTLAERDPGLPVPAVVPDRSGRAWSTASVGGGPPRLVWMLTYLAGRPIAGVRPVTSGLLEELGTTLARLDLALTGFAHPAARRELKWDLARAGWIREHLDLIPDPGRRSLVEKILARYDAEAAPALPRLRRSVVYADANEHNVLARVEPGRLPALAGLIDFGDMIETVTVAEVAVAAAYASFGATDPLAAVLPLVAGYHRVLPAPRRRDRRPRHPRPHPPRGERRQFRLPGRGRARRSLPDRERSPGLGRSRSLRQGAAPARPLRLSRRLRPLPGPARPGRRALAREVRGLVRTGPGS